MFPTPESVAKQTDENADALRQQRLQITSLASSRQVRKARSAIQHIAQAEPVRDNFFFQPVGRLKPIVSIEDIPSAVLAKDTLTRVIASDVLLTRRRKA